MSSLCSFAPSTKRSHPESNLSMMRPVMELECMVAMTSYISIVLYWRRVAGLNYVNEKSCRVEEMLDRCSS